MSSPAESTINHLRRFFTSNESNRSQLLSTLATLEATDPASLLHAMFPDRWQQAQVIPVLWQLIATRQIATDLSQPLTMYSRKESKGAR